jgi:hypothetical protein
MTSFFSAEDHAARVTALHGPPEERTEYEALAHRIAAEIVEDLVAKVRSEFRTGAKDIRNAIVHDRSPTSEHSPYIPQETLRAAILPLLPKAFNMAASDITLMTSTSQGDYITGTYESYYRRIFVRIDFSKPLQ